MRFRYANAAQSAVYLMQDGQPDMAVPGDDPRLQGVTIEPWPDNASQAGRTRKSDVWRRATDDEAMTLDAALADLPVRLRRLWDDSVELDHGTPEFAQLQEQMAAQFGAARAAQLLASS